jgi:hypothetical protein
MSENTGTSIKLVITGKAKMGEYPIELGFTGTIARHKTVRGQVGDLLSDER